MQKVFIRGVKGRGKEVIAKLVALGGYNTYSLDGEDIESLYFINHHKDIGMINEDESTAVLALMWSGTEIFLDEPVDEPKPINTLKEFDVVMWSNDGRTWGCGLYKNGTEIYDLLGSCKCWFEHTYIVPYANFDFNDLVSNIKRSIV